MQNDIQTLIPRQPVPDLTLPLVGGGEWSLTNEAPDTFSILIFYRGWHCPVCRKQLEEAEALVEQFEQKGAKLTAISVDGEDRAKEMHASAKLDKLKLAYGLTLEQARQWGLFISTSRGLTSVNVEEPIKFAEPGFFLIKPDNTLFYSSVQSAPWGRPALEPFLNTIDFIVNKNYPARGEIITLD
ncbi:MULTISPECIES: peroxiredoxin-like family protein [Ahrensia]|uniref:Peroxiredoxin-like family protein n=1 Tax=Ahrensia kielensis TaxID=76980 RepID=A0ABU9T6J2_9HYPH|nr:MULTISPECIES: peroxiredoxin-like family protein [Ahrensia]